LSFKMFTLQSSPPKHNGHLPL